MVLDELCDGEDEDDDLAVFSDDVLETCDEVLELFEDVLEVVELTPRSPSIQ